MGRYAGKNAVVIGGTIGVGLAVARALLDEDAQILVTGRNERNLEAARRELGSRAHVVRSDTADLADIEALGQPDPPIHDPVARLMFKNLLKPIAADGVCLRPHPARSRWGGHVRPKSRVAR